MYIIIFNLMLYFSFKYTYNNFIIILHIFVKKEKKVTIKYLLFQWTPHLLIIYLFF